MNVAGRQDAKYRQVAAAILARLEAGEWRPGDQLPSEAELARTMEVSLGTVQKALQCLADDRVIVREHGRGTFAGTGRTPDAEVRHFRFLGEGGEMLPVYARMLAIEESSAGGPWTDFFEGETRFVHLRRLLSIAGEFDVYTEFYLPAARFGALLDAPPQSLDGVLVRDHLAAHFNAPTIRVEQQLTCGMLPPRACRQLNLLGGSTGLIWLILARSYRDAPIMYQRAYVPPSDRPLQIADIVS